MLRQLRLGRNRPKLRNRPELRRLLNPAATVWNRLAVAGAFKLQNRCGGPQPGCLNPRQTHQPARGLAVAPSSPVQTLSRPTHNPNTCTVYACARPRRRSVTGPLPLDATQSYLSSNLLAYLYGGAYLDTPPANQTVTQPKTLAITATAGTLPNYDSFHRADAASLGAAWTLLETSAFGISANAAYPHHAAYNSWAYYTAAGSLGDQFAQAAVARTINTPPSVGLSVRVQPAARSGYSLMQCNYGLYMYRTTAGANTPLGSYLWSTAPGDTIRLVAAGNQISGALNGSTVIGPVTDATWATGYPGVYGTQDNTGQAITYWSGGPLVTDPGVWLTLDTPGTAGEALVVRVTAPVTPARTAHLGHPEQTR